MIPAPIVKKDGLRMGKAKERREGRIWEGKKGDWGLLGNGLSQSRFWQFRFLRDTGQHAAMSPLHANKLKYSEHC